MKTTVKILMATVLFTTLSGSGLLFGASPGGDRGGQLSAAEKAQQELLRQLRRDIAIHRILTRQNSAPVSIKAPSVKQTAAVVSDRTFKTAKSAGKSPEMQTCSNTVDNCFLKLESLFDEHFGNELKLSKSNIDNHRQSLQAGI